MLVGYMRVSTEGDRQVMDLQRDALLAAGIDERHLFEDRASGSRGDRAGLAKALAFIRAGDCLVVWKLDRLGRSLQHLLTTVTDLKARGIAFRSLTEQMDTTTAQGELMFHLSPLGWEHVNLTGGYIWAAEQTSENIDGLRSLRPAPEQFIKAA